MNKKCILELTVAISVYLCCCDHCVIPYCISIGWLAVTVWNSRPKSSWSFWHIETSQSHGRQSLVLRMWWRPSHCHVRPPLLSHDRKISPWWRHDGRLLSSFFTLGRKRQQHAYRVCSVALSGKLQRRIWKKVRIDVGGGGGADQSPATVTERRKRKRRRKAERGAFWRYSPVGARARRSQTQTCEGRTHKQQHQQQQQ